ncbi:14292_t:CDS:1, partial [Gigaspora rosea]
EDIGTRLDVDSVTSVVVDAESVTSVIVDIDFVTLVAVKDSCSIILDDD